MAGQARGRDVLSNPFFVVVLLASTVFVITVMAYLIGPYVLAPRAAAGAARPSASSIAMAIWFDQHGPLALGVEIVVIVLAWLCAIWTDPWFIARAKARGAGPGAGAGVGNERADAGPPGIG